MDNTDKFKEELDPLLQQVINICEKNKIPMFIEVQITPNMTCSYCIFPAVVGRSSVIHLHHLLSFANSSSKGEVSSILATFTSRALLHYGIDITSTVLLPKYTQFSLN
jgi:tRNA A37 methylthiotransferase MiaB